MPGEGTCSISEPIDIDRLRARDEALLKQLVRQISPRMLEAIRPYARDNDDADDLLQDSWLRVMDQLDNFKQNGSFPAWAIAVAENVARTARRRRERTAEQRAAPDSVEEVLDRGPNPEEELLFNEQRELLNSALARLPDRERDIVVLRFIEGRSTAEAAAETGVSVRSVRAIQRRAIHRLLSMFDVMDKIMP
ncbi:MAG: sigma-70 family RNA polymerase sigma factor [Gemmatimonadetes bacterium]|nr:sigma-70 family RNA polymerase sigma factor [Gemmatimonadota bacterium]